MEKEEFLQKISKLNVWRKNDDRAPHKPLVLLFALGKIQNEQMQAFRFEEVEDSLEKLLIDFGPPRKSNHPEQPFVRLKNDGVWKITKPVPSASISKRFLRQENIGGGFTDEAYQLLLAHPELVQEAAYTLLNLHFPDTFHEDILEAVGLDFSNFSMQRKKRDPKFRDKILRAYGYSCAVCGFNVRLGHTLVGIEAAHIKWHQAGGPDVEENGIALCSLHHKLFDRGVFTLNPERILIVSEEAHGTSGFEEWLMKYHSKPISKPISQYYEPDQSFLSWHVKEVFKGPERYIY
ncbi:phosphorothioated DNA-binding restriction endonuclease [Domibacillus sp.]|uniref:phosphorothioated DNA-binding restriction endonuclease n=1 Tax=Domibacillus sp. TaxID=1969783 RepID=UPI0028126ED4|nr:HNH endonuclease [Domibacillus sp.]